MSSRRRSRSRSRERARGSSSNSKLRMDTKPQSTRITDPSLPAGRRREIDNVMKKARASPNSNIYWDKKLLEVEAKDPNRWRHSGYKSMYLDGSSSRSPSPGPHRRTRSRSRSLPPSRRSPRSPPMRSGGGRSSRSPRSPPSQLLSSHRDGRRSPRSPPPQVARSGRTAAGVRPRSPPLPSGSNRGAPPATQQQPGTRRRRSASVSSLSSCSDDSCSVCSPKTGRHRSRSRSRSPPRPVMPRPKILPPVDRRLPPQSQPSGSNKQLQRVRPPSPNSVVSPRQPQRMPRPMTPPSASGSGATNLNQRPLHQRQPATIPPQRRSGSNGPPPTDPRRQPPPARPRNRAGEVIDVSASVKPPQMPQPKVAPQPPQIAPANKQTRPAADVAGGTSSNDAQQPVLLSRVKKERTSAKRASPANNAGDSSGSEDSSDNSTSAIVATTRLTLSERFGKMAQWSVDRERRIKDNNIENMRITKTGGDLKVMIEADAYLYGDAPRRYSISPVPAGHYPDDLLAAGPAIRGAAWDDVRIRYQYYKDLGYLRDLTLDDYVKWEEWWYKYQDWLANEREYEHWLTTQDRGGGHGHGHGRRRRKRLPASQRLN